EGPEWRAAVAAANPNSVAALLYSDFGPRVQGTPSAAGSGSTVLDYISGGLSGTGLSNTVTDPNNGGLGLFPAQCLPGTGTNAQTQLQGNLFDGNEGSARIDWNASNNDRVFAQMNYARTHDKFFAGAAAGRGFLNPTNNTFPNAQFVYNHTFTPTLINEFKAGYAANLTGVTTATPGV